VPDEARKRQERKGTMSSPDGIVQNVIDDLDSFYCHNIVASLWADAVANRLEGMAIYLLSDELPEVAEHARAAARRLADRIGDLGAAVHADLAEHRPGIGGSGRWYRGTFRKSKSLLSRTGSGARGRTPAPPADVAR
jgi:hypothetical protein